MANTFTPKLENFFDNNVSGGYIETAANIGGDDLTARINAVLDTKGYLTSNSNVSWLKITGKPNFFSGNYQDLSGKPNLSSVGQSGQWEDILNRPSFHAVAITGNYEDLNHLPTIPTVPEIHITNLQSTGNLIATIQIGDDPNQTYNIKVPEVENTSSGIIEETDPIFTDWLNNSPIADITDEDIENWTNKSNFSGSFNDLTEVPSLFSGSFNDLTETPSSFPTNDIILYSFLQSTNNNLKFFIKGYFSSLDLFNEDDIDSETTIEDILLQISEHFRLMEHKKIIKIQASYANFILNNVYINNNIYVYSFIPLYSTNYHLMNIVNKTDQEIFDELHITQIIYTLILDTTTHKCYLLEKINDYLNN